MTQDIFIIGATTPTIVRIIDDINLDNIYTLNILGFIDNDTVKHGSKFMSYDVIGPQDAVIFLKNHNIKVVNTIAGSIKSRIESTKQFIDLGFEFISIMHPLINLKYTELGVGILAQEGVIIQPEVKINSHVVISSRSCIAHNSVIGEYTFIGPSVYVCGRVKIGKNCYIGVGAKILPDIKIGDNSVVAAGSIVTKDVSKNSRVCGIPAKVF
jgi:sugar O-acyltransferase (sialic acid O-acetyltransferase NeuD family)